MIAPQNLSRHLSRRRRPHRRDVLKAVAAGAFLAPLAACGRPPAAPSLAVTPLADGLVMIAGAGSNVVAARGPQGAVLVDAGSAEHAGALLATIAQALGQKEIAALFTTHWHRDHTGANETLGKRGVKIIAHENTRLWMGTTIYRRWEEKTYPPAPSAARPTETFYTTGQMALGDKRIAYSWQKLAHTDGDAVVAFPDHKVIVAGGIVCNAGWPIIDWSTGGWLGGMIDGMKAILDMADDDTLIVPSDGPPMKKADLARHHQMYTTILERMAKLLKQSRGPDEVAAAHPTAEYDAEMGDPAEFVKLAFESIWTEIRMDRRVLSF
jgi:glyoxylase-like metal-dependent hydrolase (beta-lactamase superfamily II)